jgi:hypothetical protein
MSGALSNGHGDIGCRQEQEKMQDYIGFPIKQFKPYTQDGKIQKIM